MEAVGARARNITGKTISAREMLFGKTYIVKHNFLNANNELIPYGTLIQPIKKTLARVLNPELIIPSNCKPALLTDTLNKTSRVVLYSLIDLTESVANVDNFLRTKSIPVLNLQITNLNEIPLAYIMRGLVLDSGSSEYLIVKLSSKLELSVSSLDNNLYGIRKEVRVVFSANETIKLLSEEDKTKIDKQTIIEEFNKHK